MIWKTIDWKGFAIEVRDDGAIRRPAITTEFVRSRGGSTWSQTATFPAKLLRPYKDPNGYLEVAFVASRRRYREKVHRLVAMAFVAGFDPEKCVNHKNGDKFDNRPENLEWISYAENTEHSWQNGLVDLRGEKHTGAKLTNKQVSHLRRLLGRGVSVTDLAGAVGVSVSLLYKIAQRERWAHLE